MKEAHHLGGGVSKERMRQINRSQLMTEQKWEFCELVLWASKKDTEVDKTAKGLIKPKQAVWSYDCYIRYYSPLGDVIYCTLGKLGKTMPYDPFAKSMAELGSSGWELVTVHHGNMQPNYPANELGYFRWDNKVAYLKR